MVAYYKHNGGYFAVTEQSPAGFEGLVFVGRGGKDIDSVEDQLFPVEVLKTQVNVNDVPPEWVTALGYHTVQDFPLLDAEGENLVAEIPVREPVETEWVSHASAQVNPGCWLGILAGAIIVALLWPYL